jgi:MFS family permease
MTLAMVMAIVTAAFPPAERGRALGIMGIFISLGLLGGPAAGGALLDWLGWRAVFWARIPLALLALLLAVPLLKGEPPQRTHKGFDVGGAVTVFVGLSATLVAINRAQSAGWISPLVIGLFAIGLASLVMFVRVERTSPDPVLDLSLLARRVFAVTNAAHLLFYVSTIALRFGLPFLFIQAMGLPATTSGLLVAFTEGVRGLISPFSGRISDRIGTWLLMCSGLVLVIVGAAPMMGWNTDNNITSLLPFLAVFGIGMGLFVAPAQSAIMGSVPRPQLGTASGMVATTRQIGSSLGLAVAGSAFVHAKVMAGVSNAQASVEGFQAVVLVSLVFAVAGLALLLARGRGPAAEPME